MPFRYAEEMTRRDLAKLVGVSVPAIAVGAVESASSLQQPAKRGSSLGHDADGALEQTNRLMRLVSDSYGERLEAYLKDFAIEASWARHGTWHPFPDKETWMLRHVEHRTLIRDPRPLLVEDEQEAKLEAFGLACKCVLGWPEIIKVVESFGNTVVFGYVPSPPAGIGIIAQSIERDSGIRGLTTLRYDPITLAGELRFEHVIGIPGEPENQELIEKGGELNNHSGGRALSRYVPKRLV
jgi:hypothetical protein